MSDSVKAVILAAGKGTRMKSSLPKVLHKILGKALVERVIDSVLELENLYEIFVITGHQSEVVKDFLENKYQTQNHVIKTALQEPQLGTGHAVFQAYEDLKDFKGTVIVLCGDTPLLTTETLQQFVDFHKKEQASLTVMSALFDNPTNYGRIVRDNSGNLNKIVEEKDASAEEKAIKEINAGVYCIEWEKISPAFFDLTTNNEQGEYYLTDIVDWSVKKGYKTCGFILENNKEIFGINSREHLAEATGYLNTSTINKLMAEGVTFVSPENTYVSPETRIGQDSIVYPGCVFEGANIFGENCIIGPNTFIGGDVKTANNVKIIQSRVSNAYIGENSTVGPFAHIRERVEINSDVKIGNFVEVKKSTIDSNTNVSHLSYVGDSSLGKNVNIGAGTITANYDPLSKKKSKTVLEDNVKIGSNSVLVAPVTVKNGANVAAGSVITKEVPEYALAIAREKQKNMENWVKKKSSQLSEGKTEISTA
jgi:bifunctional UDP-N-acetylglucosamine pyrophosphorylase/glucosamine-1-phosphate N-acetyltransferase